MGNCGTSVHIGYAQQIADALASGVLNPRWSHKANGGLGEPIIFSAGYQLVVATISLFTSDVWLSMRIAATGASVGAALFAFFLLRNYIGDFYAFVTSALIETSPFMFWVISFYSGAPWHFAFLWLCPVVIVTLFWKQRKLHLGLALAFAALLATHTLIRKNYGSALFAVCLSVADPSNWVSGNGWEGKCVGIFAAPRRDYCLDICFASAYRRRFNKVRTWLGRK